MPDPSSHAGAEVEPGLAARCAGVEVLVLDVDGVLTDGSIAIDDHGTELKRFHVRDGWAIATWRKLGRRTVILSGRSSKAVDRRAAELGVDLVIQGASDKAGPFRKALETLKVGPHQVCAMGDDLPDLPLLAAVGLAACPADAVAEARALAHVVATAAGGRGAVREVVELILKAQGVWDGIVAPLRHPATGPAREAGA